MFVSLGCCDFGVELVGGDVAEAVVDESESLTGEYNSEEDTLASGILIGVI